MKSKPPQPFTANIYRIWMMRYVDVPQTTVRDLEIAAGDLRRTHEKRNKYIPVIAKVNGIRERTTLLPAGDGRYRMQFNTVIRKAADADVGDAVSIELVIDRGSREIPVPPDLRAALRTHAKARKAFEDAPPGLRRQILKWMESAKGENARQRRIEAIIDRMLERAILAPRTLR
jgi:hypothetical protein